VVAQLLATIRQHEEKEAQLQVKVEQLTGALTTLSEEHRRTIETERTAHQQTVETLKTERDDLQRSNAALTNALAELKEPDPSSVPSSITEDMSVVRNANEALAKEVADLKAFMQDKRVVDDWATLSPLPAEAKKSSMTDFKPKSSHLRLDLHPSSRVKQAIDRLSNSSPSCERSTVANALKLSPRSANIPEAPRITIDTDTDSHSGESIRDDATRWNSSMCEDTMQTPPSMSSVHPDDTDGTDYAWNIGNDDALMEDSEEEEDEPARPTLERSASVKLAKRATIGSVSYVRSDETAATAPSPASGGK